jgi:hypothetical protein
MPFLHFDCDSERVGSGGGAEEVAHSEPAELQEVESGRQHQLHRGLPDHRDREAVSGSRAAQDEDPRERKGAIQCPELLGADQGTNLEVLPPRAGAIEVLGRKREAEQDHRKLI